MTSKSKTPSPTSVDPPFLALATLLVALLGVPAVHTGFACLSSPCIYGICLDDLNSSFTCYCMDGYTGTLCQTNWDDCWSSPCENGATCTDGVASFNCTCPDGFTGDLCEMNVNECLSNPCLNNATCLDGDNGYKCLCEPGYFGERCEQDMAVCNITTDGEPRCHNGGLCRDGPGEAFYCDCAPGWTGKICDDPIDECASNPCQHGGVCIDLHNGFACACLFGYTGVDCSLVLEPCRSNVCENGALCLLEGGDRQHVCYCVPDFHGPRCQYKYDECLAGPGCRNGGSCIDGIDDYSCACPPQLTGNRCECLTAPNGELDCGYEAPSFPWSYNGTRGGKGHTFSVDASSTPVETSTLRTVHLTETSFLNESRKPTSVFLTTPPVEPTVHTNTTFSEPDISMSAWTVSPTFETTKGHPDVSVFLWTTSPSLSVTDESVFSPTVQFPTSETPTSESPTMGGDLSEVTTVHIGVTLHSEPSVPTFEAVSTPGPVETDVVPQVTTETLGFSLTPAETSRVPYGESSPSATIEVSESLTTSKRPASSTVPDTSQVPSSAGEPAIKSFSQVPASSEPISTQVPTVTDIPPTAASPGDFTQISSGEPYSTALFTPAPDGHGTTSVFETDMISLEPQEITTTQVTDQEGSTLRPGGPVTSRPTTRSTLTTLYVVTPKATEATHVTTGTTNVTETTSPALTSPTPNTGNLTTSFEVTTMPIVTRVPPRTTLAVAPDSTNPSETTTTSVEVDVHSPGPTVQSTSTTQTSVQVIPTNVTRQASTSTTTTKARPMSSLPGDLAKPSATTFSTGTPSGSIWPLYPTISPTWSNGTDIPYLGDCAEVPCLHGGTCVYTTDGVKCECVFGWTGPTCTVRGAINVPAFNGHSFLAHLLPNASMATGLSIGFVARTLASNGLLVHASLSADVYMSAYLEDGLLRFQFSCGVQTMLFNELQRRVDDGRDLVVNVSLTVRPVVALQNSATSSTKSLSVNARLCAASLRVNHTLAMSGEQTAVLGVAGRGRAKGGLTSSASSILLLGGLPIPGSRPAILVEPLPDPPLPGGFSGCMRDLQVNGEPRHIYTDAIDGAEITECSALACLSSPCHGAATCAQRAEGWTCLCPSGMIGQHCERSVCANNPCEFGGTCVSFPVSGFLCLCPLGKRGMFCEHDLEISTPQFSSSVGGLSSFAAYVLPTPVDWNMELRMRFLPTTTDQVSLLLFVGQTGQHGPTSDHLALSYIKGYVILTWNLGSGVRRIFTPHPVQRPESGRPHDVRIGRVGRTAWLQVDRMDNITGVSPGPLDRLNVRSLLYVGGHGSVNFSQLPHDLPFHHGFLGCVFSVELMAGSTHLPLAGSGDTEGLGAGPIGSSSGAPATTAVAGRAVGQCTTTVCTPSSCKHGICMQHGPAFTCLCQDGWFGPTCNERQNPCDEERNACSEGSTCVPTPNGYECDCRLGRSGRYCEQEEQLSDVYLSGRRSFLEVAAVDVQRSTVCLELEIRPSAVDGLVLLVGHPFPDSPFMTLSLRKGVLVATLSSARSWPLVLRSAGIVGNHAAWHLVRVCRYGRRLTLAVDGAATSVILRPGDRLPSQGAPLFIGGLPDMSTMPVVAGEPLFKGCVRRLSQNGRPLPLDIQHLVDARNVVDCDGTRCGGDICFNGGTCSLGSSSTDVGSTVVCTCLQEYTGKRCETQLRCPHLTCKNGGRCVQRPGEPGECRCPLQWTGPLCAQRSTLGAPLHFPGNAYLLLRSEESSGRQRKTRGHENDPTETISTPIGFIALNFSTISEDGMVLWTGANDQWVGIGLRHNNLTVVWGWREKMAGDLSDEMEIESSSDGSWVSVTVELGPKRIAIWRHGHDDQQTTRRQNRTPSLEAVTPLASLPAPSRPLATDGTFFIGGFPGNKTVMWSTKGIFSSPFVGCVASLRWGGNATTGSSILLPSHLSTAEGENVGTCNNMQSWEWHENGIR